jgi:hypothetical protein
MAPLLSSFASGEMDYRITLIGCVALDGSFLKMMVTVPRQTVDVDLLLTGLTPETVHVLLQPKGFIKIAILDSWFEEICLLGLTKS